MRESTRMLLKTYGYEVTAVTSWPEALNHARRGVRVDLLVSDCCAGRDMQFISSLRSVLGHPLKAVLIASDPPLRGGYPSWDPHTRIVSDAGSVEELLTQLRALLTPG